MNKTGKTCVRYIIFYINTRNIYMYTTRFSLIFRFSRVFSRLPSPWLPFELRRERLPWYSRPTSGCQCSGLRFAYGKSSSTVDYSHRGSWELARFGFRFRRWVRVYNCDYTCVFSFHVYLLQTSRQSRCSARCVSMRGRIDFLPFRHSCVVLCAILDCTNSEYEMNEKKRAIK